MPYFYEISPVVPSNALECLFCVGLLLATWGYFSLGRAFGVSPAFRFRVETGAYRYFSHPIYLGYAISETCWLLLVPTLRNALVFAISLSLYVWRANREEVVLYRSECESGSG